MPFPPEKTKQFAVQFACRTPVRKELASAERKAIENVLRDLDPETFQIFHEEHNAANLFQVSRQHHVGPNTLTVPAFVLSNDSVALLSLIMAGGALIKGKNFDTKNDNKKMASVLFEVQNALKGLRYHRAGKIYEVVLGPFMPEEKKRLSKMISQPLENVGEVAFAFAKYVSIDGNVYNFKTELKFRQLNLGDPFDLMVRVDINNRQLEDSMEPGQIEKVWGEADRHIAGHLDSLL